MTEKRICEMIPNGYVYYPQFTDEENAPAAARMNAFYIALRDAAAAYAVSLSASDGGMPRYTAEYTAEYTDDGTIVIRCTLRLRRRGRTEAQKTLIHRWRDGLLIPPRKKCKKDS